MEHSWKHYITHSRCQPVFLISALLVKYKDTDDDVEIVKLYWAVRQQENLRTAVVDVKLYALSRETFGALTNHTRFLLYSLEIENRQSGCLNGNIYHRYFLNFDISRFTIEHHRCSVLISFFSLNSYHTQKGFAQLYKIISLTSFFTWHRTLFIASVQANFDQML